MNLFSPLPDPKPDPIFSVLEMAKAAGSQAINATAGVFIDERGKTVLYPSVRKALETVAAKLTSTSFNYPSLLGLSEFREAITPLLFGGERVPHASIATTGGTGAVAVNMRLLLLIHPAMQLILPTPTWPTHRTLATGARLPLIEVPHIRDGKACPDGILEAIERTSGPRAVLLQTGCHNPTGLDFTTEHWKTLASVLAKENVIGLLDTAYQGFGAEPEKDMEPLRICREAGMTVLQCWSAAKNHSLYSERAGLAFAVTENDAQTRKIEGLYGMITRTMHSATATFGQYVVAETQRSHHDEWLRDIAHVRETLTRKRKALKLALPPSFSSSLDGNGMFAVLPLSPEQIRRLREEHKVFLTNDARMNIAGIPLDRMDDLKKAVEAVST